MIKLSSNLQNLVKRSASSAGDYAMYGGAGALGGAGLGALINYLRDKSVAEGALVGGGGGLAAGLGTRGILDLLAKETPSLPTSSSANPGRRLLDQLRGPGGMVGAMAGNVYQGAVGDREQQLNNERNELAYIASLQAQQAQNESELNGNRFLQGGEGMSARQKLEAMPAAQQLLEAIAKDEQELERFNNRAALRSAGADPGANLNDFIRIQTRRADEQHRQNQTAKILGLDKNAAARSKRSASSAGDYAMYGGAGALGGAGLGALINYLRDQSVAQGALVGGGLGGAAGLGTRGILDLLKSREYSHAPEAGVGDEMVDYYKLKSREYSHAPEAGVGDEMVDYYKALQAARDQAESMPYRGDVEMADADASYEANADLRASQDEVARLQELVNHYQGPEKARIEKAVGAQLRELNRPGSAWKEVALEDGGVLPAEIPPQFGGNKKTKK